MPFYPMQGFSLVNEDMGEVTCIIPVLEINTRLIQVGHAEQTTAWFQEFLQ